MIEETLKSLGLSDKEITIYMAVLPLGNASASVLADRTGIVRPTVQYTCQQLQKKGLLGMHHKKNSFIYFPEDPSRLLYLLDEQKRKLDEQKDQVDRIVGEIKNKINPKNVLPKIRFYEGKENVLKSFLGEIMHNFDPHQEVLCFSKVIDEKDKNKQIINLANNFIKARVEKKVPIRLISRYDCERSVFLKKTDKKNLRTTRLVESKTFDFPNGEMYIYQDRVYLLTIENELIFCCVIENHSIAQMHRSIFELVWERSKEEDLKLTKRLGL